MFPYESSTAFVVLKLRECVCRQLPTPEFFFAKLCGSSKRSLKGASLHFILWRKATRLQASTPRKYQVLVVSFVSLTLIVSYIFFKIIIVNMYYWHVLFHIMFLTVLLLCEFVHKAFAALRPLTRLIIINSRHARLPRELL